MPRIRKSTTFVLGDSPNDVNTPIGVSETIPDMAMPLREILDRHTRGLEVPQFKPVYNDEEIPDLSTLDIVDRMAYIEANKERITDIRRAMKETQLAEYHTERRLNNDALTPSTEFTTETK